MNSKELFALATRIAESDFVAELPLEIEDEGEHFMDDVREHFNDAALVGEMSCADFDTLMGMVEDLVFKSLGLKGNE